MLKKILEDAFDTLAIHVFSNPLMNPSPELVIWRNGQFQGFSFKNLAEKYMIHGTTLEAALMTISKNASKPNYGVSAQMAKEEPTKVTRKYKSDMIKHSLFRAAFFESLILKYEIVQK